MEKLFQRHYDATCKRGLIDTYTTTSDFIEKMKEEYKEVLDAFDEETGVIDGDMAQECIDLACVVFNMLIDKGFDIEAELEYNVKYQEKRSLN
jgi:hypothetical protein